MVGFIFWPRNTNFLLEVLVSQSLSCAQNLSFRPLMSTLNCTAVHCTVRTFSVASNDCYTQSFSYSCALNLSFRPLMFTLSCTTVHCTVRTFSVASNDCYTQNFSYRMPVELRWLDRIPNRCILIALYLVDHYSKILWIS